MRRHLADEPVTARRPTAGYRLRKLARRQWLAFVMAGAVAVVVGVIGWAAVERRLRATDIALREDFHRYAMDVARTEAARERISLATRSLEGRQRIRTPTRSRTTNRPSRSPSLCRLPAGVLVSWLLIQHPS